MKLGRWQLSQSDALLLFAIALAPLLLCLNLLPYSDIPLVRYREGFGLPESVEWRVFFQAWITIPAVTIALVWVIRKKARHYPTSFYQHLAAGMAAIVLTFLLLLFGFLGAGDPLQAARSSETVKWAQATFQNAVIIATVACSGFVIWLIYWYSRRLRSDTAELPNSDVAVFPRDLYGYLLPVVIFWNALLFRHVPFRFFQGEADHTKAAELLFKPELYRAAIAACIAAGLLCLPEVLKKWKGLGSKLRLLLDVVFCILLFLICFDTSFTTNRWHQNVYLGPINDAMHGRCIPNESSSLYGVGLTYSLAAVFKSGLLPLSYRGFSALNSILYVFVYVMLYASLRVVTRRQFVPALAIIGWAAWQYHAPYVLQPGTHPSTFPQQAPLRIWTVILYLFLVAIRLRFSAVARLPIIVRVLEAGSLGLAMIWSLEAAAYHAGTFLVVTTCEVVEDFRQRRFSAAVWVKRLGMAAVAVALAHGAVAAYTLIKCGQWPRWDWYIEFALNASITESSVIPWTPWQPVLLTLYGAAIYVGLVLFRLIRAPRHQFLPFLAGVAAAGVLTFTYYLGYSLVKRLAYIGFAPIAIGAVVFAFLLNAPKVRPLWLRLFFGFLFYSATLGPVVLLSYKGPDGRPYDYSLLKDLLTGEANEHFWQRLWDQRSTDPMVRDTIRLVEKYAPSRPDLPLLLERSDNNALEVLRELKRVHTFPTSKLDHDEKTTGTRQRVLGFQHNLRPGDVIFVHESTLTAVRAGAGSGLLYELASRLKKEFHWELLESTPSGVHAFRLARHKPSDS